VAKNYPNRSDLRDPTKKVAKAAATGQAYGEAGKQMAAQRAMPIAPSPTTVAPQQVAPRIAPGQLGDFARPTERPDEPVTAGMNFGAGPNATQAGVPFVPGRNSAIEELKAIYRMFPNDDLADLIDSAVREGL